MNDKDITFLEKVQLYKKLNDYFSNKIANEEESHEDLNSLLKELNRWGKDLRKRIGYYDL
tara:strand:- start:642 stop:821 length:180 start_codon:yes stop_codon:yes gene_type:complete